MNGNSEWPAGLYLTGIVQQELRRLAPERENRAGLTFTRVMPGADGQTTGDIARTILLIEGTDNIYVKGINGIGSATSGGMVSAGYRIGPEASQGEPGSPELEILFRRAGEDGTNGRPRVDAEVYAVSAAPQEPCAPRSPIFTIVGLGIGFPHVSDSYARAKTKDLK